VELSWPRRSEHGEDNGGRRDIRPITRRLKPYKEEYTSGGNLVKGLLMLAEATPRLDKKW